MKRIILHIYIIGVTFCSLALPSCQSYLDINANPNAAEEVPAKLLFSNATVSYINIRSGGSLYIPLALAGQSIAGGGNNARAWGSNSEERYQISGASVTNTWRALYTSVGGNLKQVIKLAENGTPRDNNTAAQAKVLLAFVAYDATTLYGDVPFREAWDTSIPYPRFDTQKEVLEGILNLLDEAMGQLNETETLKISDYDLFYKGDLTKWKRAAQSLKLRTLMTMVDADPSKAAAIGQLVSNGDMIGAAGDNFLVAFQADLSKANPKHRLMTQFFGGTNYFWGSSAVVDFMRGISDPRLPYFFDKPADASNYLGLLPGVNAQDQVHVRIAKSLHRATAPEIFFSFQEQLFFEAEVYARGLGVPPDLARANALYKQAVEQSAIFWGVGPTAARSFSEALPDLSPQSALPTIHYHHWVDKMDRGLDAFTQWRRSGPEGAEVPSLAPPPSAPAGGLFRRFPYPVATELAVNPNAPITPLLYTQKMWFDL